MVALAVMPEMFPAEAESTAAQKLAKLLGHLLLPSLRTADVAARVAELAAQVPLYAPNRRVLLDGERETRERPWNICVSFDPVLVLSSLARLTADRGSFQS